MLIYGIHIPKHSLLIKNGQPRNRFRGWGKLTKQVSEFRGCRITTTKLPTGNFRKADMNRALFEMGQIVATPGALAEFEEAGEDPSKYLQRHQLGDWGDLGDDDKRENDFSVGEQLRIFSAYVLPTATKIWIITEADRSATTLLLPEEY